MKRPVRKTQFDGAVLADCLFLVGQSWVKSDLGDRAGAAEDLAAAGKLLPADSIETIRRLIETGFLPEPGPGPEAMDAWLEACRMAGAGEWTLTRYVFPDDRELQREAEEAFRARLARIVADGERRKAAGELPALPPLPPQRPAPWEDAALEGLNEPGSLSESLRKMGLM